MTNATASYSPSNVTYSEVYRISAENLYNGFKDGSWGYCEPEYYIRNERTPASIEAKKRALISLDPSNNRVRVEVTEPCKVYKDKEGCFRFFSGNTRAEAILELLDGKFPSVDSVENPVAWNIETFDFIDIPYQLVEGEINYEVAAEIQTVTNDFTEPHTPYEKAKSAYNLKQFLLKKFQEEDRMTANAASTLSTKVTMERLKIGKEETLSQYITVIQNPEFVHEEYLKQDKIALDTVVVMSQKFRAYQKQKGNKLPKNLSEISDEMLQQYRKAYHSCYEMALLDAGFPDDKQGVKIYRKHVQNYFLSLTHQENANEAPVDLLGNEVEEADSSDTSDSKKEKKGLNDVIEKYHTSIEYLSALNPDDFQRLETAEPGIISNVLLGIAKADKVLSSLLDDNTAKNIFAQQQDIFLKKYESLDYLVERLNVTEVDLSIVFSALSSLESPAKKLYDKLYEAPKEKKTKKASNKVSNETDELNSIEMTDDTTFNNDAVVLQTQTHEANVVDLPL